jgi:hypothetical protein
MIEIYDDKNIIKNNELRALSLIEAGEFRMAEKYLQENVSRNTGSTFTYNLLIRIYTRSMKRKGNLSSIIKVLNAAIKNTRNCELYRRLKKHLIIDSLRSRAAL